MPYVIAKKIKQNLGNFSTELLSFLNSSEFWNLCTELWSSWISTNLVISILNSNRAGFLQILAFGYWTNIFWIPPNIGISVLNSNLAEFVQIRVFLYLTDVFWIPSNIGIPVLNIILLNSSKYWHFQTELRSSDVPNLSILNSSES